MDTIQKEMNVEKDRFLEECDVDPSIKDKLAVLYRTFDNRKRVRPSEYTHIDYSILCADSCCRLRNRIHWCTPTKCSKWSRRQASFGPTVRSIFTWCSSRRRRAPTPQCSTAT